MVFKRNILGTEIVVQSLPGPYKPGQNVATVTVDIMFVKKTWGVPIEDAKWIREVVTKIIGVGP